MRIDINCDMGESFGNYVYGADEDIVPHISSANIACGFHAGDPLVMSRTVGLAKSHGVAVGAHPSFPDLLGFGRRDLAATEDEIRAYVTYQIGALAAFARVHGVRLTHVKGHGAIYNMAAVQPKLARAMAEAVARFDPELVFVGLAGSALLEAGREVGLAVAAEAFADRAYNADGTLVSRRLPGAVLDEPDEVATRVVRMTRDGSVVAADGSVLQVDPDTICVHGDTPGAAALAAAIRSSLTAAGIEVGPLSATALRARVT